MGCQQSSFFHLLDPEHAHVISLQLHDGKQLNWTIKRRHAGHPTSISKKSRPFHRCRHKWWLSQSSWGWTCFCSKPVYMTTCLKKNSDCQAAFWHSLRNLRADFLRMLNHWCAHIRFALTLGSNHAWPGMQILASQQSIKAGHVWVKSQTIFWNWAAIFGSQLLLLLFFLVQHDLLSHTALILVQASKAGKHQHHLQSSLPFHQSVSREFYCDSFSRNFITMKLFQHPHHTSITDPTVKHHKCRGISEQNAVLWCIL